MSEQHKFIHLRLFSLYSLLESTLKIGDIIDLAVKNNMPAIGVTDNNNLFGALEFANYAIKSGIQPINGVNIDIKFVNDNKVNIGKIILLAKDKKGFQNLLKLSSLIYTDRSDKEKYITIKDLEKYHSGLILLSGYDIGPIGKLLLSNNVKAANIWVEKLKDIFGNRFYMEICRSNSNDEKILEKDYINLALKYDIPLVATNKVLFSNIEEHSDYNILRCIKEGLMIDSLDHNLVSNQSYFKSQDEMIKLFHDIPEAIENTINISKRCSYYAETSPPILPKFIDGNETIFLTKLSNEGLEARLEVLFNNNINFDNNKKNEIKEQYFKRLNYELEIIVKMNFAGYFLIVSDFIRWAKEQNIAVGPGRGSGVGSIVAWSLSITDVDPIEFGLLFERFLNPERVSMPDFDIDFCQERREEVIQYVRDKYGNDRVANIITFGKLQAKAAIKDVARVMGLSFNVSNYLTDLVPFNAVKPVKLMQALKEIPELKDAYEGKGLYNIEADHEVIQQVLKTSLTLEGLCKNVSLHAAGIVISGKPLIEMIPLYKDSNSNNLVTQYSMQMSEASGLVKFDFLGLQTLTVISKCKDMLLSKNINVDFEKTGFKDIKTYEMLSKGNSVGVFQFESVGMKDSLKKLKPDNINDIVALGALYRPGPMDNIPTYIACKHGEKEPNYIHSLLVDTLKDTYGVCVYQEQVMEIAKILAGYTLGGSDLLRRAMGKKIESEMKSHRERFIEGAKKNNITKENADNIFDLVAKFAGYGFNKSHAVAYGIISYQTAYLKANYPVEFFISYLNLEINDQNKICLLISDAISSGIKISPPSLNQSEGYFIQKNNEKEIIFAFGAIKNISPSIGDSISTERKKNGDYVSIKSFLDASIHFNMNKKILESLIKSGSLDLFNINRKSLMSSIPKWLSYISNTSQDYIANQASFDLGEENNLLVEIEDDNNNDKSLDEFDVTGLCLSSHPLDKYSKLLEKYNVIKSNKLFSQLNSGYNHIMISAIIHKKDVRMSGKKRFVTLTLSDSYGFFEATIFDNDIFKLYGNLINVKELVVFNCEAYKSETNIRLVVKKIVGLETFLSESNKDLVLHINSKEKLHELIKYLKKLNEGNRVITIEYKNNNGYKIIFNTKKSFAVSSEDINNLSNI